MRLEAERGRRIDRAFGEVAPDLDPRERAFTHELAYGTTRLRGRLDQFIAPHVRRGLDSVDPTVLELLRLGAYQILYMDGVPGYAAVSETVDQVRAATDDRPAGFANAVLRKVQAAGVGPDPVAEGRLDTDPVTVLSGWGSHPEWLVRRWLERWSPAEVLRLVDYANRRPSTCLVPLRLSPAEAVTQLAAAGVASHEVEGGTRCVRLADDASVSGALAALPEAIVQDPAANLVSKYADVPPGGMVADFCSAPGGKVLALSDRPSTILAADRSESRLRMVKDNAERTGTSLQLVVMDALHPAVEGADVVLLDVPCTGTGTFARHPDARWRLRPEAIAEMAGLQARMLDAAADAVAPGGLLVYSTCTLEPEENEQNVAEFLSRHADYSIERTRAVPAEYLKEDGSLHVTPQDTGFDGSFAARMRRAT